MFDSYLCTRGLTLHAFGPLGFGDVPEVFRPAGCVLQLLVKVGVELHPVAADVVDGGVEVDRVAVPLVDLEAGVIRRDRGLQAVGPCS